MDTAGIITELENALTTQLEIAAADPAVETAGKALLASLRPAVKSAAISLAEQAAEEVRAQLPDHSVDVVIGDGEPALVVRAPEADSVAFSGEDLAARLTVRLPSVLKHQLEEAAGDTGDSVNAYIIKTLASRSARRKVKRRVTETFDT
jgi:hypothetical protein